MGEWGVMRRVVPLVTKAGNISDRQFRAVYPKGEDVVEEEWRWWWAVNSHQRAIDHNFQA